MRKSVWIILIILVLIVGGYFIFFYTGAGGITLSESSLISRCEEKTSYDRQNCFIEIAELKRDISYCDTFDSKIEEPNAFHQNCVHSLSMVFHDSSLCSLDERGKENCLNSFEKWETSIENSVNPSTCRESYEGNSKIVAGCISTLAIFKENPSWCEEIEKSILSLDVDESIAMYEKDRCFYHLAGNLNDKSLCEEISPGLFRNTCLKDYNFS